MHKKAKGGRAHRESRPRMIWKIDFGERDWHHWFAWYPVRLSFEHQDKRAWLEWIERRTNNYQGYLIHHYRPIAHALGPRNEATAGQRE